MIVVMTRCELNVVTQMKLLNGRNFARLFVRLVFLDAAVRGSLGSGHVARHLSVETGTNGPRGTT